MARTLTFDTFAVDVPEDWELVEENPPALARPEGAGALQFSGFPPDPGAEPITAEDLLIQLEEFAAENGLGDPADGLLLPEPRIVVAASFRPETWLVRVWYLTDGASLAFVTYTADADHPGLAEEQEQAEAMIASLCFFAEELPADS